MRPTSCPWALTTGTRFKRCVTYVQEAGLPARDVDAILGTNAQKLLQLQPA